MDPISSCMTLTRISDGGLITQNIYVDFKSFCGRIDDETRSLFERLLISSYLGGRSPIFISAPRQFGMPLDSGSIPLPIGAWPTHGDAILSGERSGVGRFERN